MPLQKANSRNLMTLPDGRYRIEEGLYLVVRGEGKYRSYVFRYKFVGARRDLSLGSPAVKTLSMVKEDVAKCRLLIAKGIDPKEAKDQTLAEVARGRKKVKTFDDLFRKMWPIFLEKRHYKNERTERDLKLYVERYACPQLGNLLLTNIKPTDVRNCLAPIWTARPVLASRVRWLIEALFELARAEGLTTAPNPATWKGNLDIWLPSKKKVHRVEYHPAIAIKDLPGVASTLFERGFTWPSSWMMIVIILSASRTQEVRYLEWKNVLFDGKMFLVPPEHRKDGKEEPFRVPMTRQVERILKMVPQTADFVFHAEGRSRPYQHTIAQFTLEKTLKLDCTMHGFRSAFRDWCAESGVDFLVAEKSLMHSSGSVVVDAYQRSDLIEQRREALQRWADYVLPEAEMNRIIEKLNKDPDPE